MKTPMFIEKIDWSELRNQKTALVKHIEFLRIDQSEVNQIKAKNELADYLEGILNLIDAVQDYAVDEMGMNSNDIYDFEQEDNELESGGTMDGHIAPERSDLLEGETDEQYFARTNAKTIFEMHVEGTYLYENEIMSEEFIDSILKDEQHATAIKNVICHAILEDIKHGTITTLEYNVEMYEYGYKIEDYCMEQFYKGKTKTIWVCPNCGSSNVQFKTWTDANTFQATKDECPMEDEDCYCNDCKTHGKLITKEVPLT